MMGAYIIGIVVMLVSLLVSHQLKSRFQKYSATPLANGMSGAEIAQRMLHDHGIGHDGRTHGGGRGRRPNGTPGQELEQDGPEGPDVGAVVDVLEAAHLLR